MEKLQLKYFAMDGCTHSKNFDSTWDELCEDEF